MSKHLIKITIISVICVFALCACSTESSKDCIKNVQENATSSNQFPDGTTIDNWFSDYQTPSLDSMGKIIKVNNLIPNDYTDDVISQNTKNIQTAIDNASNSGGGVIYITNTYYIGSIFFKPNVNLYIEEGAMLKGSADITHYPVMDTRIEGESCKYYPGLINADKCDNFKIAGKGTIDGNGQKSWEAYRQRQIWNKNSTNKDEQRARILFVSNSKNVYITGVTLKDSQFWSSHIYKCDHVKFIDLNILAQIEVKPYTTDAIDIDACTDVLVKKCYMRVYDDGVVLKGGKGPWADEDPNNGANERIIVEDCHYGFCLGCLTCGSESIHNKNVIVRNCQVDDSDRILWLKFRTDTPSNYEYITVENITGKTKNFIYIYPWTQYFDLKGRTDKPKSHGDHITMRNCNVDTEDYYNVEFNDDQYILKNFCFKNNNVNYQKFGNEAFKE